MYIMDDSKLTSVSGALSIMQNISTEGITQICVEEMVQSMQAKFSGAISDQQALVQMLSACTFDELRIIQERLDATIIASVVE